MMKRLFNYFIQGLIYIAPIAVTAYIIYNIFSFIDGLLEKTLEELFGVKLPGLGILTIILFLILVGFLGQTIIARPLKRLFERVMHRAPFLRIIYSAINDLFSAVVGKRKKFNVPVLVLVNPISNLEKLGFLTEEDLDLLDAKDKVAVYFPHSYNFSGELFIVPRENVKPININSADVMKFIVSGGVAGWKEESSESQVAQERSSN
ncbi:MAG: DUF502 domain-containing protein [Saprospiraceae bacterium]|nr:DUF502 domain-containing protein [Saprospiraceae bacterium]